MGLLPHHLVEADVASVAASGMHSQRVRMNAIANNIANIHTTRGPDGDFAPFLRKEVLFQTKEINPEKWDEQGVDVHSILPGNAPLREIYDPTHPEADASGKRKVPRVTLPLEMANMIEASRAYEANLKAMKVGGGALKKTTSILDPVQG
jgi:flagellar basal-body rod protein FlgC